MTRGERLPLGAGALLRGRGMGVERKEVGRKTGQLEDKVNFYNMFKGEI